jgi:hypothetical protein
MLFAMRVAVVLLAWTALLLPWERCHAMCHDEVRPALAEHDCHGETCHRDDDAQPCGRGEAGHETFEFVSLRPTAKAPLDAFALVHVAVLVCAPVPAAVRLPPTVDEHPAPDLLRTTVLLL